MRVVAIDQGTTSTKAFILNETGFGEIVCYRIHKQYYPNPGWVEHDPLELLANIQTCLDAAGPVEAIGIANQGESCLGWDARTGEPVSSVIVWQDRRTEDAVQQLKLDSVEGVISAKTGLRLDSYFSATKLSWIVKNIPEAQKLLKQGHLRLGTTDAFFLDRLTGHFATDVTTASRTSLFNLKTLQWDPELCEIFDVPIGSLPEIKPTTGDFGVIKIDNKQVPVTTNIVDQQASLFGHGCRNPGETKITFGTGAFAMTLTDGVDLTALRGGLLPTIAWQLNGQKPVFALDGGVYCAGSALNWAKSLGLFEDYSEINNFRVPSAISRGVAFVPSLTGLGCPHWDNSAVGLWIGMSLNTTKHDLVQSVLEGIAFRAVEVLDAIDEKNSIAGPVSIDGGMAQNDYFCQFLANVLQKKVVAPDSPELSAIGTAMLTAHYFEVKIGAAVEHRCFTPVKFDENFQTQFSGAVSRARGWHLSTFNM